uniref:Tyrosine-protein phosphatase domain-containing protein n=1 Tax=Heterorhabditis bacteriophora TaxID=37862 RepID=A0A1I7WRB4_HETBA
MKKRSDTENKLKKIVKGISGALLNDIDKRISKSKKRHDGLRTLDMGVEQLRREYRSLAKYTLPEMTCNAFKNNQEAGRNRYFYDYVNDVPCQDQHRVILTWPGSTTDYIHANYVGTPVSQKRFICTQGPLECTSDDFWMMVAQEEAETIIMLCNCIETFLEYQGKIKCAQYWPVKVGEAYKFKGGEIKNLEELLSRVRGTKKPIIVHCSAGIGRTGTIQYLYIHRVMLCYFLEKHKNSKVYYLFKKLLDFRYESIMTEENQKMIVFSHISNITDLHYNNLITGDDELNLVVCSFYIPSFHSRGTMGLYHRSCLEHWLSTSRTTCCEICKFKYEIGRLVYIYILT